MANPPKPRELRVREGGTAKRGDVSHRPLPEPIAVKGRADLSPPGPPANLPAEGKTFWQDVVVPLFTAGVADLVDVPALTAMATAYARMVKAREVINEVGMFGLGSMGQVVEHPAVGIETKYAQLYLRYAIEFAATASARARLGLAHLQGHSLQAELMSALTDAQPEPDDD